MQNKTSKLLGGTFALVSIIMATEALADCGGGGGAVGGITLLPSLGGNNLNVFALTSSGAIGGYSSLLGEQQTDGFTYANGTITDIGTLGGTFSQVLAMNSASQATGSSSTSGDAESHAFFLSSGGLLDLGTLGGSFSTGVALNDSGVVTGNSTTADGSQHAFISSPGGLIDIGNLGGDSSTAIAINGSGTVTGDSITAAFTKSAYIYTNGTMISLGDLGSGYYSSSRAINDAGSIVGESADTDGDIHAFLYSQGAMKDLGTLGGPGSTAVAINNAGQIIGTSYDADFDTLGFISDGTALVDLGTLGGIETDPFSINNLGVVVGQSLLPNFNFHAFMWQNGVMTDLNTLLPANSGWVLSSAQYINDSGRIVGFGDLNGQFEWFILDPSSPGSGSAPVAIAGADQTVECSASAVLDGSASTGNSLSYSWAEGNVVLGTNATLTISFGLGNHTVTLTVTDACDSSSSTNVIVHVVDHTAPVIVGGPGPLTASANANCEAAVPNIVPLIVATDTCTAANALLITQNPTAGTLLGLGNHMIVVTVKDASGNSTAGSTAFNVADTTAPVIQSLASTPNSIWPPNNKMVAIKLTVGASDSCDSSPVSKIVSITCNEPTSPSEIKITGNLTASVAATRNGSSKEGRIYTVTVKCTDASGNFTTKTVDVTVPHNN